MTEQELNDSRQRIASRIREARFVAKMTQATLAEKTGMGIATIKRFESGRFWLNMKQYILIRQALELPEIG
jgi:transcriptional regulator with XRE-family HTH domain